MKKALFRLLPRKNSYLGIDVGTRKIKSAEVKVAGGVPEVVSLKEHLAPPGVWSGDFDEEALVQALGEIACPGLGEVVTCLGGEVLISRVVRMPPMTEKEMTAAARFEIQKFVPLPLDQLIVRQVPLDGNNPAGDKKAGEKGNGSGRTGRSSDREEGRNVLLLAVPASTLYRYYSIFSRAGLLLAAVDLKAFALWRLFGEGQQGTVALVDIGAGTSQLVLVKDGVIQFIRLLPVGTDFPASFHGNGGGRPEVDKAGKESAGALTGEKKAIAGPGSDVPGEQLSEIARELRRTLEYYSKENVRVKRLILSGGASRLKGLSHVLQEVLGLPVETSVPEIKFSPGVTYDPAYAVAIGLALRGVG